MRDRAGGGGKYRAGSKVRIEDLDSVPNNLITG